MAQADRHGTSAFLGAPFWRNCSLPSDSLRATFWMGRFMVWQFCGRCTLLICKKAFLFFFWNLFVSLRNGKPPG